MLVRPFFAPSGPITPEVVKFASSGDAPFPTTPERLAVSIAYRNGNYIADSVSPRVGAGTQSGAFTKWDKAEGFRLPATHVSRDGNVQSVRRSGTEGTYRAEGYGLKLFIPNEDIRHEAAAGGISLVDQATEFLTDLILLDRDNRLSTLLFASGTYGSSNKTTLSGTSQWSDFTNSTPISDILTGFDAIVGGRINAAAIGQQVWTKLRQHPTLVKAVQGANNASGIITREQFRQLFELDKFDVGDAWINTAAEGATDSYSRVWGKAALFYVAAPNASLVNPQPTLTMSPQWGQRVVYERVVEPGVGGLLGGIELVVGEYVDEIVPAADAGYLFLTAVA